MFTGVQPVTVCKFVCGCFIPQALRLLPLLTKTSTLVSLHISDSSNINWPCSSLPLQLPSEKTRNSGERSPSPRGSVDGLRNSKTPTANIHGTPSMTRKLCFLLNRQRWDGSSSSLPIISGRPVQIRPSLNSQSQVAPKANQELETAMMPCWEAKSYLVLLPIATHK